MKRKPPAGRRAGKAQSRGSRARTSIDLDQEALDAFDRLEAVQRQLEGVSQLEQEATALRKQLAEVFGAARMGVGPGGRRILHLAQEQSWKALPARTITRHQFHEVTER